MFVLRNIQRGREWFGWLLSGQHLCEVWQTSLRLLSMLCLSPSHLSAFLYPPPLFSFPFPLPLPILMNILSDKSFHSLVNLPWLLSDSRHGAKVPTLKCTLWTWPVCLFSGPADDFTRQKYLEQKMARDREAPVGYDFGHSVNTFTLTSCKKPGDGTTQRRNC